MVERGAIRTSLGQTRTIKLRTEDLKGESRQKVSVLREIGGGGQKRISSRNHRTPKVANRRRIVFDPFSEDENEDQTPPRRPNQKTYKGKERMQPREIEEAQGIAYRPISGISYDTPFDAHDDDRSDLELPLGSSSLGSPDNHPYKNNDVESDNDEDKEMRKEKEKKLAEYPGILLDRVPDGLLADKEASQDAITGIFGTDEITEAFSWKVDYRRIRPRKVLLSELRKNYEGEREIKAMETLKEKNQIEVDGDYTVDPFEPDVAFDLSEHYLDFVLAVSGEMGLACILPTIDDHTFHFTLDLHHPLMEFSMKHARLGFSPGNAMMYLGRSRGRDNVWLAMAPNEFVENQKPITHYPVYKDYKTTAMTAKHYATMTMFFAHLMHKGFGDRDIVVYRDNKYPHLDDGHPMRAVKASTNIM